MLPAADHGRVASFVSFWKRRAPPDWLAAVLKGSMRSCHVNKFCDTYLATRRDEVLQTFKLVVVDRVVRRGLEVHVLVVVVGRAW